jgi:hypothetical protein
VKRQSKVAAAIIALVSVSALAGCSSAGVRESSGTPRVYADIAGVKQTLTPVQQNALRPIAPSNLKFAQNKNLRTAQIIGRFETIDSSYKIGQPFDAQDAEFVRAYATPNPEVFDPTEYTVQAASALSFSKSGSQGGNKCAIAGSMSNTGGPFNYKWSTKFTMSSSAKITKSVMHAHVRSYGVFGSSGVGLAYSSDNPVTTSAHSYTYSAAGAYTSAEVYSTMYDDVICYYSGGNFTVTSY